MGVIDYISQNMQNEWFRVIFLIVSLLVVSKLFLWAIQNIVLRITSKTSSDADDRLVKSTSMTLFFLILTLGLRFILAPSPLVANYTDLVIKILDSLSIIFAIYVVVKVFDIIIISLLKKVVRKYRTAADNSLINLFHRFALILSWFIGLILILSNWGVEIGPLLASLGVAGIAVAFALQTTLGNIFGGVSLVMDRNIAVGDVVDVAGDGTKVGEILDIGLRSTKIRTYDNEMLIIPSGTLASSTFINRAKPNLSLRVVVPFGVAYGTDIEKVKKLVHDEISKIKELDSKKSVSIKFLEMADSSLNFKVYFYISDYTTKLTALDKANTLIYNVLNKNRIEIPYPQMDIHMKRR
ncbi:mechanosensitive ion channel family protein [Candidatus Woesearchaeota archaeon]|nr:mechanosensitive ion channel family protein [Candidatus Woesearchaeota archaeon]